MNRYFLKFKLLSDLRSLYTSNRPEVTAVSTGALHVDPQQLLATEDAKRQLDALRKLELPIVTNVSSGS
jgi:hypothetical protein